MPKHCKYRNRMVRTRYDKCCLQLQVNTSKTVIICNLLPNILVVVSGVFIPLVICAFSDVFNINSTYFRYSFALTCSLASPQHGAREIAAYLTIYSLHHSGGGRRGGKPSCNIIARHYLSRHNLRNLLKFMYS